MNPVSWHIAGHALGSMLLDVPVEEVRLTNHQFGFQMRVPTDADANAADLFIWTLLGPAAEYQVSSVFGYCEDEEKQVRDIAKQMVDKRYLNGSVDQVAARGRFFAQRLVSDYLVTLTHLVGDLERGGRLRGSFLEHTRMVRGIPRGRIGVKDKTEFGFVASKEDRK